jgi:hypothetical protein
MRYEVFWATSATAIPVLALALIVEARVLIQRWGEETPWWVRSLQGVGWAIPLIGFAIVEPLAFKALSGGKVSAFWISQTIAFINASIFVLLWGPALELLTRSNARIIAWTMFNIWTRKGKWKQTKLLWRIQRQRRFLANTRQRLEALLARLDATESKILSSENPDCESSLSELREIKSLRDDTQKSFSLTKERQAELEEISRERQRLVTHITRLGRAVIPSIEASFAEIDLGADRQAKLENDLEELKADFPELEDKSDNSNGATGEKKP